MEDVREDGKKVKVPAEWVHLSIERLIKACQAERIEGEKFADWVAGQEMTRLAALITPDE